MRCVSYKIVTLLLAAGTLSACATGDTGDNAAEAEDSYPTEPITVVIPFSTGGGADSNARLLGPATEESLPGNTNLVMSNIDGATGSLGMNEVLNAEPDGYTIGITTSTAYVVAPHTIDTDYEPDSFECVAGLWEVPSLFVVGSDSEFESFEDVVAYAEENPNTFTFATSGVGSSHHIAAEALAEEADIEIEHIPHEGSGPALSAVVGGQVDAAVVGNATSAIDSGQVLGMAALGDAELAGGVSMPTASELGYDVDLPSIGAAIAPPDTPSEIVDTLTAAFEDALSDDETAERLSGAGYPPAYLGPEECQNRIDELSENTAAVMEGQTDINE